MKDKTEEDSSKPWITLEHLDEFIKAMKHNCDCDESLEYHWEKEAKKRGITTEELDKLNEMDTIYLWCSGDWCSGPFAFIMSKSLHRRLQAAYKQAVEESEVSFL